VCDVLTKRKYYYSNFKLERHFAAFAVVGLKFYLFGGQCGDHNSLHSGKDSSEYQIIPYQMNAKADNAEKMFEPLEEGRLLFPRVRSACITDGTN
jgi:hypothetical protein